MDEDVLRARLAMILQQTSGAEDLGAFAYWVGDTAGERQLKDNLASGRVHWKTAHDRAQSGLAALDAGELEIAELYAWEAVHALLAAFETRMRPSDWAALGRPSQRRGRPPKKFTE